MAPAEISTGRLLQFARREVMVMDCLTLMLFGLGTLEGMVGVCMWSACITMACLCVYRYFTLWLMDAAFRKGLLLSIAAAIILIGCIVHQWRAHSVSVHWVWGENGRGPIK